MASIRKAKKLGTYKKIPMTAERKKLINSTIKKAELTNKRLKSLKNAGYEGTWSSKKLEKRLQAKTLKAYDKSGKVKINKIRQMNNTQLVAMNKKMDQFLESKTSTPKGIREVRDATIESLRKTLSDEERGKVSAEDAEFYYDMFGSDDFNYFAEKIGASTLWTLIDESIEDNDTEDGWLHRLSLYITLNDKDIRERAIRLYDKYVN